MSNEKFPTSNTQPLEIRVIQAIVLNLLFAIILLLIYPPTKIIPAHSFSQIWLNVTEPIRIGFQIISGTLFACISIRIWRDIVFLK